jgi:hypothetical protein
LGFALLFGIAREAIPVSLSMRSLRPCFLECRPLSLLISALLGIQAPYFKLYKKLVSSCQYLVCDSNDLKYYFQIIMLKPLEKEKV